MKKSILSNLLLIATLSSLLIGCGSSTSEPSFNPSTSSTTSTVPTTIPSTTIPENEYVQDFKSYVNFPFLNVNDNLSYRLSITDTVRLDIKLNSVDDSVFIKFKNEKIKLKSLLEDKNIFVFYELNYLNIEEELTLIVEKGNSIVSETSIFVKDYLSNLITNAGEFEDGKSLLSLNSSLASFINYVSLTRDKNNLSNDFKNLLNDELKSLIYNGSSENIYHVDWTKRDWLSINSGGSETFTWGYATLDDYSNVNLNFTFSFESSKYDNLNVKYQIGDREYKTTPIELSKDKQTEQGRTIYQFTTEGISPLDYHLPVKCNVYSNDINISGEAEFSLTRALAKIDIVGSDNDKLGSRALYSLGKAFSWYKNAKEATYDYLPSINDNGIYTLEIGEYKYDDARMLESTSYSAFGAYVYSNGHVVSSGNELYQDESLKIENVSNNDFKVTLKSAFVDGILLNNNANATIVVESDSVINGALYRSWDDKAKGISGSIISSQGNVKIECLNNAKLVINGQLYIDGELSFDNANVEINSKKASITGLEANKEIIVNSSTLKLTYDNSRYVDSKGVKVNDKLTIINSDIEIKNFDCGIYLNRQVEGELDEFSIDGTSKLNIDCFGYGFNSHTYNRLLNFVSGDINVRANTGINFANITLDSANLYVESRNGYCVESSLPVSIKTTSQDYNIGMMKFVNNTPYNEWWDVNYSIRPEIMDINGATIYVEGSCRDGVVQTVPNAIYTLQNTDFYIKSYKDGHGIGANASNERINIENTSRLIISEVDIPIWNYNSESPLRLAIRGDLTVNSYRGEINAWGDTTIIEEGSPRYFNKRS